MGPEGNILENSSISTFQQGFTHSAIQQVVFPFKKKLLGKTSMAWKNHFHLQQSLIVDNISSLDEKGDIFKCVHCSGPTLPQPYDGNFWRGGGGGVIQKLTIADRGGERGLWTIHFGWRNMWTAPYWGCGTFRPNWAHLFSVHCVLGNDFSFLRYWRIPPPLPGSE